MKDRDLSGNTEGSIAVHQHLTDRTGTKITMPAPSFDPYLKSIQKNLQKGSERSHYPALKSLLDAPADGIDAVIEEKGNKARHSRLYGQAARVAGGVCGSEGCRARPGSN